MLTVAETYDRLAPRVRSLAGVLAADPDVVAVGAAVRMHGIDHEVRLERNGDRGAAKLTVRTGAAPFYRGPLAQWYGAVEKAKRSGSRTGGRR